MLLWIRKEYFTRAVKYPLECAQCTRGIFNSSSEIFRVFNKIFCRGDNRFQGKILQVTMSFYSVATQTHYHQQIEQLIGVFYIAISDEPFICTMKISSQVFTPLDQSIQREALNTSTTRDFCAMRHPHCVWYSRSRFSAITCWTSRVG